jgi:hypothetical protein
MKRVKEIINRNLSGKKVLSLFILTNVVYAIMLVVTIPKVMSFSKGMKLLDMMPTGYNLEYVTSLFEALGVNGREAYLYSQIPVDMIYPLLFGVSYCLLMAYFLKKIGKLNSTFFYLCFLPVIAGVADYFENFGIINMLNSYPDLSQISVVVTNTFSIVKSMTTTVYFIALLVALLFFGVKVVKARKTSAGSR